MPSEGDNSELEARLRELAPMVEAVQATEGQLPPEKQAQLLERIAENALERRLKELAPMVEAMHATEGQLPPEKRELLLKRLAEGAAPDRALESLERRQALLRKDAYSRRLTGGGMNEALNNLIAALREEMTQYGELLALMQEQQELIINRSANELLINLADVNQQVEKISTHREHRDAVRRGLVQSLGGTEDTTFKQMTALLPEEYQPLLNALVEEINQLLQRIQTWVKQNHLLLKRSLDLMSKIMHTIFPTSSAAAQTYGQGGTVNPIAPPPSTLYEGLI